MFDLFISVRASKTASGFRRNRSSIYGNKENFDNRNQPMSPNMKNRKIKEIKSLIGIKALNMFQISQKTKKNDIV